MFEDLNFLKREFCFSIGGSEGGIVFPGGGLFSGVFCVG